MTLVVGLLAVGAVAMTSGTASVVDIFTGLLPKSMQPVGAGGEKGAKGKAAAAPFIDLEEQRWVDEVEQERKEAADRLREFDELMRRKDRFKNGL